MKKPSGCVGCPFFGDGYGFVPAEGNPRSPWAVLEAPGRWEVTQERPVVGPAGKEWEKALMTASRKPRDKMYITNTLKCQPPYGAKAPAWAAAIRQCRQYLDREALDAGPGPPQVLLYGGYALQGWFGTTLGHGGRPPRIVEWRGTLLRQDEWLAPFLSSKTVKINKDNEARLITFPSNPVIMPTLHPSFIIRDAWSERINQIHDIRRALRAFPKRFDLMGQNTDCGLGLDETVFDVETTRNWRELTIMGLLTSANGVMQFKRIEQDRPIIQAHLSTETWKIGHNLPYDIRTSINNGFSIRGPFWDTIAAAKLEEPDLDANLATVASRTLPDYFLWKGMAEWKVLQRIVAAVFGVTEALFHAIDWWLLYNQFDLYQTARVKQVLERRLTSPVAPGLPSRLDLFHRAYVPLIPRLVAMTEHGMRPIMEKFKVLEVRLTDELAQVAAEVDHEIGPAWTYQVMDEMVIVSAAHDLPTCSQHPKYNGIAKLGKRKCLVCKNIYAKIPDGDRIRLKKSKAAVKKYEKGINPGSADHWRWIVYDHLGMPVKEKTKPSDRFPKGQPSVDDDVIRLMMNKSKDEGVKRWLGWRLAYSRRQHQLDSFVKNIISGDALDPDGVLRPDYNSHRTSIGRLSSGGAAGGEK